MDPSIGMLLTEILKSGALNEYEILAIIVILVLVLRKTPFLALNKNKEKTDDEPKSIKEAPAQVQTDLSHISDKIDIVQRKIETVNHKIDNVNTSIESAEAHLLKRLHQIEEDKH